jgi:hypothetical protein
VVAAAFKYIERADDVALDMGVRLFQRMAHPRLSAQMHDALESFGGEQPRHRVTVGQVHMDEPESSAPLEPGETGLLERHVVVVIQVVESDNLVAAIEETLCGGRSNKPRGARNEKFHRTGSILEDRL